VFLFFVIKQVTNPGVVGKHLSREEVLAIVAPPKIHHDFVVDWFKSWRMFNSVFCVLF
jgi:hypothetical protein